VVAVLFTQGLQESFPSVHLLTTNRQGAAEKVGVSRKPARILNPRGEVSL